MSGQHQPHAQRFGLQAGVKPDFAGDQAIAAGRARRADELAGAAAGHGHALDGAVERAHRLHVVDRQQLFDRARPARRACTALASRPWRPAP